MERDRSALHCGFTVERTATTTVHLAVLCVHDHTVTRVAIPHSAQNCAIHSAFHCPFETA